jgi:hypothetical protein
MVPPGNRGGLQGDPVDQTVLQTDGRDRRLKCGERLRCVVLLGYARSRVPHQALDGALGNTRLVEPRGEAATSRARCTDAPRKRPAGPLRVGPRAASGPCPGATVRPCRWETGSATHSSATASAKNAVPVPTILGPHPRRAPQGLRLSVTFIVQTRAAIDLHRGTWTAQSEMHP